MKILSQPIESLENWALADSARAMAGRIFVISGLDLEHRSPVKRLFNISISQRLVRLHPTPEPHALGSYETWRRRTSPLET